MTIAIAFWSVTVKPGKPTKFLAPSDIRITNASLGDELKDQSARTVLKLNYTPPQSHDEDDEDDEEEGDDDDEKKVTAVLCALTPGKIEQATLDLVLEEDEEYEFHVSGKNAIHLAGNYIDQRPEDVPFNDEDEPSDEEDFDLREVSSDVEIDPRELDIPSDDDDEDEDRFEELPSDAVEVSKKTKRARDEDTMETDEPSESDAKLSKKERKKKNKKLKAEDGQAVEAPASKDSETSEKAAKTSGKKANGAEKGSGKKEEVNLNEGLIDLPGGLKIKDVKTGNGRAAKKGDKLAMRYIGKLDNGKIFDKNTNGKPFRFNLGAGEVIKGWDEGIVGMQPGGERYLIVPPKMGYGNRKSDGIPAGSTLRFELKLIEIK